MAFANDYKEAQVKGEITLVRRKDGLLYGDKITDTAWLRTLLNVSKITTCTQCDELGRLASGHGLSVCYLETE